MDTCINRECGTGSDGDRFMIETGEVTGEDHTLPGSAYIVYDNREKAEALVKDLIKADMEIIRYSQRSYSTK